MYNQRLKLITDVAYTSCTHQMIRENKNKNVIAKNICVESSTTNTEKIIKDSTRKKRNVFAYKDK